MSRKVVQILPHGSWLVILTDDGKLYRLAGDVWIPLPDLPQD